ncbi:hypothetical protein ACLK19_06900 [Escherichia coli]
MSATVVLQRYLPLHITTNRGNKDAFTWELGEYTLTSGLSVQR